MTALARTLMTDDEFLLWCLDREERWELVDGFPVEMMTRASRRHDRIIVNVISLLHQQLRGTGCTPATADIAVKTRRRTVRRPDITVTCDPPSLNAYDAEKARMVIEVLSPSTRGAAWHRKIKEYEGREGLEYILLIESESVGATLFRRSGPAGWDTEAYEGLDAVIDLPAIGCRIPMSDIYDGTE
jgi:Uma2 family endonuclease